MNLRRIVLPAIMFAAWPVAAREKTDVLVMKNGDRLTCEIKSLSADVLYIKLDYALGTVSINWFEVDHLESNQLFVVKTQDGEVYSGTLSMPKRDSARPASIEIINEPGEKLELERDQISKMDQSFENWWHRFNGSVGLGAIYNKGNQTTQYELSTDVNYPRERWSASVAYNSTLSSNKGASASSRNQIDASAQHLLPWNHWYYTGFSSFLQSSEQGIDLQSTLGGGVGRYLKNTNHTSISVAGGLAFQRINYQQNILVAPAQDVGSAWVGTQAKLFKFAGTTLPVLASLLPALSDPGRVHFNLNTSYHIKIGRL